MTADADAWTSEPASPTDCAESSEALSPRSAALAGHHALRSRIIPRPEEPPPPKQLALFVPHGTLELPAITTLLESQLRSGAPHRLSWMTLLARVFRVDISVCPRCAGPMRVTRALTTPEQIAAELRGARPPPRPEPPGQLLLFSLSLA